MITREIVSLWLEKLADVYSDNKEKLTELDSAIGDADHGINMARGFAAVKAGLTGAPAGIAPLLKATSMTLIKTVGGASGPLYGTFFMKMSASLPEGDEVNASDFIKAMQAGLQGIMNLGKSSTGEKTMVDAWTPALSAAEAASAKGEPDKAVFTGAADAAEAGMKATIPMLATKGRASYLGERSVGHQDPGATSTWLMLKALAEVM